jgi:hypothetical protein
MIDLRTDTIVSKAGCQPDALVVTEMRRKHPNARLGWAEEHGCWSLIDVTPGLPPILITLLRSPDGDFVRPTLQNTVYYLDAIHPDNLNNEWAMQRFIRELDEDPRARDLERKAKDAREEGHRELWNAFKRKIMVPRHLVYPDR